MRNTIRRYFSRESLQHGTWVCQCPCFFLWLFSSCKSTVIIVCWEMLFSLFTHPQANWPTQEVTEVALYHMSTSYAGICARKYFLFPLKCLWQRVGEKLILLWTQLMDLICTCCSRSSQLFLPNKLEKRSWFTQICWKDCLRQQLQDIIAYSWLAGH